MPENKKSSALELEVEERPEESILELINKNSENILVLQGEVENLQKSLDLLNSDSSVLGSVDNKISEAFEWVNIEV